MPCLAGLRQLPGDHRVGGARPENSPSTTGTTLAHRWGVVSPGWIDPVYDGHGSGSRLRRRKRRSKDFARPSRREAPAQPPCGRMDVDCRVACERLTQNYTADGWLHCTTAGMVPPRLLFLAPLCDPTPTLLLASPIRPAVLMNDHPPYPPDHPMGSGNRPAPSPSPPRDARRHPPNNQSREWSGDVYSTSDASRGGGMGQGPSGAPMGSWNAPPPPMFPPYQAAPVVNTGYAPPATGADMWVAALQAATEINKLTREVGNLRVQLTDAHHHYNRLQADYNGLDRECQELRDENTQIRVENEKLGLEVQELRLRVQQLPPPRPVESARNDDRRSRRQDSPRRARSPSPRRERPPSPRRARSPSPHRERSPPPRRARTPSPRRARTPSPRRARSPSPRRMRPPSPHKRPRSPQRPLIDRIRDAEPKSLAARIQSRSPPPLRQRVERWSASPPRASGSRSGPAVTADVVMTDSREDGPGPLAPRLPGGAGIPPGHGPPMRPWGRTDAPPTGPANRRGPPVALTGSAHKKQLLPGAPARMVPMIDKVPVTHGLVDDAIDSLCHQPDPDLENSGQPLSAWYLRWISKTTTAEEYVAMDIALPDSDEEYTTSEAQLKEVDCPFPDPIAARRHDMTKEAEDKESAREYKARNRSKGATPAITLLEVFRHNTMELGDWAGTTIVSVVQAHNLRWLATVEFERAAIEYLKNIRFLYVNDQLRRTAGIRYLFATAQVDNQVLSLGRRADLRGYYPALSTNNFPFPPPDATPRVVCNYFRNVPTKFWSLGLCRADGSTPERTNREFAIPAVDDAYAAFAGKHTQSPPYPRRSQAYQKHATLVRTGMISLFGTPGLYRHICDLGGYFVHPRRAPAPYPYCETDVIHMAAWLAEFGVGDVEEYIAFHERSASMYIERNAAHFVLPFASIDDFDASIHSQHVIGREVLIWGLRAFAAPEIPSARAFIPESGDEGRAPSEAPSRPRSVRSQASAARTPSRASSTRSSPPHPQPKGKGKAKVKRIRRDDDSEVSLGSSSDGEFGMSGARYFPPGQDFGD